MAYNFVAYIGEVTTSHTMTNKTIIMTPDNICMLLSDIKPASNISAGGTVFTLPDPILYPKEEISIVVPAYSSSNPTTNYYRILNIQPNGTVTVRTSTSTAYTLKTNGLTWHINDKFYSNTIGNTSGFTRPYNAR